MSDPKRQAKRATRAERRAAEEAAQQARAEQAAKERKQQTIIGCIVVAIIVVLVAIAGFAVYKAMRPSNTSSSSQQSNMTVDEAYSKLKKVSTQPANADDKAGFVISNKGYGQKAEGAPTVSIYMEPLCPGCASVNRQLDPTLVKLMNAGQLNIDLHFLNFQNNKSSDNYSNRVFNGAIYIAEHDDDPDHLMSYLSNIYAEDFQPGELSNYEPVNNAKLEKQAVKRGCGRRGVQRQERIPRLAHRLQQLHDPAPRTVQQLRRLLLPHTHHQRRILGSEAAHAGGHEYGGRLPQVHWAGC